MTLASPLSPPRPHWVNSSPEFYLYATIILSRYTGSESRRITGNPARPYPRNIKLDKFRADFSLRATPVTIGAPITSIHG